MSAVNQLPTWNVTPPLAPSYQGGPAGFPISGSATLAASAVGEIEFLLRGDFSTQHPTMLAPPASGLPSVGSEITPGTPVWTELQAMPSFASLALAASAKVTATLSGGSVGGWSQLTLLAKVKQAPVTSSYSMYLEAYKSYVELMEGPIDLSKGLKQGLRLAHDKRAADKKAAKPKVQNQAADPASKRSVQKAERSARKAKNLKAKRDAEAAERNLAQARANALTHAKKQHVKTIADLKATLELHAAENAVAATSAARAAKIRSTDPSITPSLDIDAGWKLVTKARTPRTMRVSTTRTVQKVGHPSSTVTVVKDKQSLASTPPSK